MSANGNEPAHRPEEVMVLDNRGAVHEIRTAGLTKREAFAMAAMQGLLASSVETFDLGDFDTEADGMRAQYNACAERAAGYADALLAELEKQP